MKVLLLTNILSPYRKVFYDKLYEDFLQENITFKVLVMAETEPDRSWHFKDYAGSYCELLESKTIAFGHIYLHFNRKLEKVLEKEQPDLIIASGSYISPSVLHTVWQKKRHKYRIFFWSESHLKEHRSYNHLSLWIREQLRSWVYHKFDGYWYAGSKSLEFIKNYAGDKELNKRYYYIPNLVEPQVYQKARELRKEDFLKLRQSMKLPLDNFIFVLPARLTRVKGIQPFMDLFVQCKYKDRVSILVLGEGELREELQTQSDVYQIDLRFMGYQSQQNTVNYYALADCFLLPSLSDPNPLSCLEALWAGLPLMVSEHVGNYPEVVISGQNGYVFSYKEPLEAVGMLDILITSDQEWKTHASEVSVRIAEEQFNPEKAVRNLVKAMVNDLEGQGNSNEGCSD